MSDVVASLSVCVLLWLFSIFSCLAANCVSFCLLDLSSRRAARLPLAYMPPAPYRALLALLVHSSLALPPAKADSSSLSSRTSKRPLSLISLACGGSSARNSSKLGLRLLRWSSSKAEEAAAEADEDGEIHDDHSLEEALVGDDGPPEEVDGCDGDEDDVELAGD
jgi:hypothetical protein